ncbi:MAG: SH3 domain-containing protein [Saprospiraceae bacterium]|nr:SH3 domain-containing protein [Saprospiraceae bacterium]
MSVTKLAIPTLLVVINLLAACNNVPNNSGTPAMQTPPPVAATPPPSAKPEMHLYMAKVDKLNLRDQPNKSGKVITQFKEGEFLEATGEVSANKEIATLRGIEWEEPYYKVTSTTPEQHTGWAYGGALQRVYSGPRATSPDLGKLSQLSMFFKTLDVKKLDSGKKAWDYVKANLADSKGTLADASLILLEQFLFRMETEGELYKMTEKVKWTDEDYQAIAANRFDMNKYPAAKTLGDNGFRLATGEGMVFPVVDWNKLSDFLVYKVTPPMKGYLQQTTLENLDNAMDDGGFSIPMAQIADRAVFWEKFNQDHPYFVLNEETRESQRWLLHALTNGADNTPVFNSETKGVQEEFATMWKYVQEKYAGTAAAKRVKEFSELVAAEGGKTSKKVENMQQKYNEEMVY